VVSLFGFWVWFFFSPHMADVARNLSLRQQNIRDLDRTCTKPDCNSQSTQTHYHSPHVSLCLSFSLQWVVILPFSGWRTFLLLLQR
jgi:hypothetical protein